MFSILNQCLKIIIDFFHASLVDQYSHVRDQKVELTGSTGVSKDTEAFKQSEDELSK